MVHKSTWISYLAATTLFVAASEGQSIRTVAVSGQPATALGQDVFHSRLSTPTINQHGDLAFVGTVSGSSVQDDNNQIVWKEVDGDLVAVAREGDPAPETGSFFSGLNSPALNNLGEVAFHGTLTGGDAVAVNGRGVWSEGGGSGLSLVARAGMLAPGANEAFDEFGSILRQVALDDRGDTLLYATLGSEGTAGDGIWINRPDIGLALVARSGQSAPGTAGLFRALSNTNALNGVGQIAFFGLLERTGDVTLLNDSGIWQATGVEAPTLSFREGDPIPRTSLVLGGSGAPALNDRGDTAFFAFLNGPDTFNSNKSIWKQKAGQAAEIVVRTGNPAPGTEAVFDSLSAPVLNAEGQIMFLGVLRGMGVDSENDRGLWKEGAAGIELVAREGDPAPGMDAEFFSPNRFVINARGQVAFDGLARTEEGLSTSGIWAQDASGELRLIVGTGDVIDVDNGPGVDLRTVSIPSIVGFSGNEDGKLSGFNDLGQIAFYTTFTDRTSGVFVANLVAIPEPATPLLLLAGACGGCIFRRRLAAY